MSKKSLKENKKNSSHELGTKGIFIIGIMFMFVLFGVIVSNLQTNGYKSKAADVINCTDVCAKYLPNSAKYTAGKAPCTQSCEKVAAEIAKGTPCKDACDKTLMGRAGICKLVCDRAGIR